MCIDTLVEDPISLAEAAKLLPKRRAGKKPNVATLYRWSTPTIGCRGVVLETIQVGATRCTSREALQRFFERLSSPGQSPQGYPRQTTRAHKAAVAAAEKLLDKAGI